MTNVLERRAYEVGNTIKLPLSNGEVVEGPIRAINMDEKYVQVNGKEYSLKSIQGGNIEIDSIGGDTRLVI